MTYHSLLLILCFVWNSVTISIFHSLCSMNAGLSFPHIYLPDGVSSIPIAGSLNMCGMPSCCGCGNAGSCHLPAQVPPRFDDLYSQQEWEQLHKDVHIILNGQRKAAQSTSSFPGTSIVPIKILVLVVNNSAVCGNLQSGRFHRVHFYCALLVAIRCCGVAFVFLS